MLRTPAERTRLTRMKNGTELASRPIIHIVIQNSCLPFPSRQGYLSQAVRRSGRTVTSCSLPNGTGRRAVPLSNCEQLLPGVAPQNSMVWKNRLQHGKTKVDLPLE